tara:strand:+ start:443 stop:625 length:183 start_codon:yes stop_codon:yes gene_type:complete
MSKNRDLKVELVNELSFLVGIQEKVWQYHPSNPEQTNVEEVYSQLELEIAAVEKQLGEMK